MERTNNNRNLENKKPNVTEDFAIVLDVITANNGFGVSYTVQAIGFNTFVLFELIPKKGVDIDSGEKVYIGDGKRDKIQYIKRVLYYDKLSGSANSELYYALLDIIDEKEDFFVNFFNTAGPISLRRHALEIIGGIGKKHLTSLLDIRNEKPFESFEDIKKRCVFIQEPKKLIADRIVDELKGTADMKFFVKK